MNRLFRVRRRGRPRRSGAPALRVALIAASAILAGAVIAAPASAVGPAANITLSLSPSSITADGVSTTTATATVTDSGANGVPGESVTIAGNGGQAVGPVTDNLDGTYTATITSSTTAGQSTITATDGNLSAGQVLTQTPGPATNLALSLSPSSITADGASTAAATATVTDANGNAVPGETVTFTSSDTGQTVNPPTAMTDAGGVAGATITSSTTAGQATITATDGSLSTGQLLTQTPGPAANLALTLSASSIPGDGFSTTTATATVTDSHGNGVPGEPVTIASNRGQAVGPVTDNLNGTYTATITSTTTPGRSTITATDGSLSAGQVLTQSGPPTGLTLSLSPSSIPADGVSTTTATATVTNAGGIGLPGATVTFSSSDPGQTVTPHTAVTDAAGVASATITSSTTAGQPTITATDGSFSAGQVLTQNPGPARNVALTLSPSSILAGGAGQSIAVARVTDAHGNLVPGDAVTFSATDPGLRFGPVTDVGGLYVAAVTGSTTAGTPTVIATDRTAAISGQAILQQVAGPPQSLTVQLSSPVIVANGIDTTTATATLRDVNHNPVSGHVIRFSAGDRQMRFSAVTDHGDGTYTVTITGSTRIGTKSINATDTSASPSLSAQATLGEVAAPSLVNTVTMTWTFFHTPTYTKILSLVMRGEPPGATVLIGCRGRGCPFGRQRIPITAVRHCRAVHHHTVCGTRRRGPIDLTATFRQRPLLVGARVIVEIVRRGWIGKYYTFKVQPGRPPAVGIACLTPGARSPGAGC